MHRFVITTHTGLPGVRLSCQGGWGGVPYPDDATAVRAAQASAGRDAHTFERETVKMRPKLLRDTDPAWLAAQ